MGYMFIYLIGSINEFIIGIIQAISLNLIESKYIISNLSCPPPAECDILI